MYLGRADSSNITIEFPKPRVYCDHSLLSEKCTRPVAGESLQEEGKLSKYLGKQYHHMSSNIHPFTSLEDLLPPKQQMPKNSQGE